MYCVTLHWTIDGEDHHLFWGKTGAWVGHPEWRLETDELAAKQVQTLLRSLCEHQGRWDADLRVEKV